MTYTGRDSSDIYVSKCSQSTHVACNVRIAIKSSRLTALPQETEDVRDEHPRKSVYFRISREGLNLRPQNGPARGTAARMCLISLHDRGWVFPEATLRVPRCSRLVVPVRSSLGARTGGGQVAERAQLGTGNGGNHEPDIRSSTRETKERAMWPTG